MFLKEVRQAFRILAKNPGFTAVAAFSLALGVGANSALFSFHDALLFRPLPVREPGSVVAVTATGPEDAALFSGGLSYPNYRDLRERSLVRALLPKAVRLGLVLYQPDRAVFAPAAAREYNIYSIIK